MSLNSIVHRQSRRREQGYALLTLLLTMALLIIAAGVGASSLAFSIRRDREEELIHRGVQYTRAIREFTKKTGRFPIRLEELDSTNGRRFLRKHYKDPITGKDFKLVHMSDIQIGGAPPLVAPKTDSSGTPDAEPANPDQQSQATSPQDPGDGSQPTSRLANNQPVRGNSGATVNSFSSSGQPITGGLIVGVVSASTAQTIREFNRKKHYNEWRFYYDTSFDRNYLANAPTERPAFQPMNAPGMSPINGALGTAPPAPSSQPFGNAPQQTSQ